jgi:hypothetical protein
MSLVQSILLFLPLCYVICFFSSAMRRPEMKDVVRHSLRLFAVMVATIFGICIVLHLVMESVLPG